MRLTESQLRTIIRRALVEAESGDGITVGDVRGALEYAKGKKIEDAIKSVASKATKKGAKVGVKSVLSLIPGAAGFVDAVEAGLEIKDLYDAALSVTPKQKKSNPLWDMLTVDPNTSQIVDDAVEQEFVDSLGEKIAGMPDDAKIPNADDQLKSYLRDKYAGAYITKT